MKLTTMTQISVDGVMQNNGAPTDDHPNGFERGGWLFPETGPDLALDLVESRVDSKGVTIQVYRPAGRPRYATA
ncbi:hypothetical protein [Plantactinospora sp. B5E13]|uniref:hypothetical protein n=1 Tax=unclassified Plantactinospora TaxID=2631981 RepID=UPI00325D7C72